MHTVLNDLLRVGPGNPILLRVVTAGGRRFRHALTRWIYLALLIGVLLIALLSVFAAEKSLSDLAKASTKVFAYISIVQLGMICLLAPIFTAGAITQERDSQTYNILLATPLTNAQIVMGMFLSRMYYVVALLLSGVPVFAITLFYGGVTGLNIALSFAIALTTGLVMGSIAISMAVFRLGTGKTVFWFYVFNAVFLVGLYLLDNQISTGGTTWLTGIHPFLALHAVVNPSTYPTPDLAYPAEWWRVPLWWYRVYPAYAYVTITLALSLFMVGPSALVLRRVAQRGDVGWGQYLRQLIFPKWTSKTRRVRHVWANPVAWREAQTRAGASARGITRWLTIVLGVALAVTLLYYYHTGHMTVEQMRQWLVALVIMEFSVALLVATNSSASAVTRERESRTLDLLLVTPITSHYYIWGKLRGLVSFMLPFAMVPTITVILVVLADILLGRMWGGSSIPPVLYPEVILELPIFLTVLIAWACMLGLQLSLKWSRTIVAVMVSVGVLAGLSGVLGACGVAATQFTVVGLVFSSLSPFTGLCVLLDPQHFAANSFDLSSNGVEPWICRIVMFISYLLSSAGYCVVVWAMYRSMVKNFDMVIRRQHQ